MCKGHPASVTICGNYVALLAIGSKTGKVHAEHPLQQCHVGGGDV